METTALLSGIERKIKKLKAHNERLEKDNEELRKSLFDYLQKIETQKKEFERSKLEIQALQVARSTNLDTAKLRKDLDHYIYLVNKCIASIHVK